MKITDSIKNVSSLSVGGAAAGKSRATSSPASPVTNTVSTSTGSDSVASTSAPLQALQSTIASSATYDAQKVDSIRQAIANGQFSVDTSKVANELINSVRGLLGSNSQA